MRYQDVFNEYAKIAQEKGLITEAKEETRTELSSVELLYGLKPNNEKKDIIDEAHPETVVIAPSYDRLNGVVENGKERQKMIIDTLTQVPHSRPWHHRYAEDLAHELIRLGYLMDNQNQEELAILADNCSAELRKEAVPAVVIPAGMALYSWIAGIAAGSTLLGLYNNFGYLSQGIINDCENAVQALTEFSQDAKEIAPALLELSTGIAYVRGLSLAAQDNLNNLPKASGNMVQSSIDVSNSKEGQAAQKSINSFKEASMVLANKIKNIYLPLIENAELEESKGSIMNALTTGWRALFGSTKATVIKTLNALIISLASSVKKIEAKEKAMKNYVEQNKQTLIDYLSKEQEVKPTATKVEPVKPSSGKPESGKPESAKPPVKSEDVKPEDLLKELSYPNGQ